MKDRPVKCPECGKRRPWLIKEHGGFPWYHVECRRCHHIGKSRPGKSWAIAKWNEEAERNGKRLAEQRGIP